MYKDKDPITLSGKVYVGVYLAPHYLEHKLPSVLQRGDIQISAHLDERGRANRSKKTKKARMSGFSGYFSALLFDGQSWRTFRISDIVEGDGWYTSQKWKHWKIHSVIWKLQRVAGRIARAGEGTYVLCAETQAAPASEPVAPLPPPPALRGLMQQAAQTLVETPTVKTKATGKAAQLELF